MKTLTASFHLMVCTSSSCVKWASFPLDLIFFGNSFWNLGAKKGCSGQIAVRKWQLLGPSKIPQIGCNSEDLAKMQGHTDLKLFLGVAGQASVLQVQINGAHLPSSNDQ